MQYLVGVDIGGTFTDLVAVNSQGTLREAKVPTTDPVSVGIVQGLEELGIDLGNIGRFAHGTTIATNALVQKAGARTAIVTTAGFRDMLEIRRTNKGDLYDLKWRPPRPIVERANRLEVRERVSFDGTVLAEPEADDVERVVRILRKRKIESVAVIFLHSYVNDTHERWIKRELEAALPGVYVTISADVLQEFREFERTATVAANAYVAPVVARYVDDLGKTMQARGFTRDILVMQSNGGLASMGSVSHVPAKLVASGPAGGTIAMAHLAELTGHPNLVGLDIGGTTADVSVVWQGTPRWANKTVVEFGLPVAFPAIDVVSIGAGGGTCAWIDVAGKLRMGPMSAGANPGPACYGAGGERPTSTDAQLVLGRLSADNFLGGKMTIYPDLAARAVEDHVAKPLGLSLIEAAHGMVTIMTHGMVRATRFVSVERGYDPRDFILCAFGGGGAIYGPEIARELHIPRVLVPAIPGVLSAYGMLAADMVQDASRSVLTREDSVDLDSFEAIFLDLEARVLSPFQQDGVPASEIALQRYVDVVYSGQTHSIAIPLPMGAAFTRETFRAAIRAFHSEHLRRFRHSDPGSKTEFINLRVFGTRKLPRPEIIPPNEHHPSNGAIDVAHRPVYFEEAGGLVDTQIYERWHLGPGSKVQGPAIIEQMDSTTVVSPGMSADVDHLGNLFVNPLG